jgi:hypothetical protein
MQKKICVILILTTFLSACNNKIYIERATAYMNASNPEDKSKYMAEGFRSYFAENGKGDGKNREQVLTSFMEWDGPMHPDIPIQKYTRRKDTFTVYFVEKNDFTKLIGYPGWKGKAEFVFDSKKMIEEYIYYPDSTNASYKPYLQPAIIWLQKNKSEELAEVYRNGKLVQNEEAAKHWIRLLNEWKKNS